MALFGFACIGLLAGGANALRNIRSNQTAGSKDCNDLADVTIKGHELGDTLVAVCQNWPLGEFPLDNVNKARETLEAQFGEGGAWDQLQKLRAQRAESGSFCWRNYVLREVRNAVEEGKQGCEERDDGVCYGDCPYGYVSGRLSSKFKPVCHSACSDSTMSASCGFGCSTSKLACFGTVFEQVKSVAILVLPMLTLVTGSPDLAKTVKTVVDVADFIFGVFKDFVLTARKIWQNKGDKWQKRAAILIMLYQSVKEVTDNFAKNLRDKLGPISNFILDLLEKNFDKDVMIDGGVPEVFAGDKGGATTLEAVRGVVAAFTFPQCEAAEDVVFTVDEAGDDRILGPWVQRDAGRRRRKPKYSLKSDSNTIMEWDSGDNVWMIWVDRLFHYDKRIYINKQTTKDYPVSGWQVSGKGQAPAPILVVTRPPKN